MPALLPHTPEHPSIPLTLLTPAELPVLRENLSPAHCHYLDDLGFDAVPGRVAMLAGTGGRLERVLVGFDPLDPISTVGALPSLLPAHIYHLTGEKSSAAPQYAIALGWALGSYQFNRYRQPRRTPVSLAVEPALLAELEPLIEASTLVRDLVNTPTEDMGPEQLADTVKRLSAAYGAEVREWVGDELLAANFPTIHAVGRASQHPPRLIELNWGAAKHPKLAVIGKGVCFDSGGLDIKPSDGMRWMKKDMGGAAHAIGLAQLIMQANLPVRLQLLVPAVENAIAGNALRPGDVLRTRGGHSVEIDNTDAEGRLILCDALSYAAESHPELILDFATLTGAARVALGPDLPALFSNRDELATALLASSQREADPLWRLPLWRPYRRMLDSYLADFANGGPSRHAGAITAALYLERFVPEAIAWMHVDVYAWNDADRPGRPRGGEAQGLRAFFGFLKTRYRR